MILCNHDQYCYDYFIKWVACLIQFPSIKLPMPVFVSREGGGKGSLLRFFSAVLGASKILQTQEPSKEVWGEFNSLMLNSYLVCLDEISKKEMTGCEGKIKGLITEPTIRINDKGKSRFEVPSYHKFIAFSNPDAYGNEPMNTTDGDRRKWFVQCSDELVRNKPYFDKFYKTLDDVDSMKTVFEFFNTLADAQDILSLALPVTEYNQSLKDMAVPPLKMFMTDFITTNAKTTISTGELYEMLKEWTSKTGIRYECNSLQFACRLSNLKIPGMEKSVSIGALRLKGWTFDIQKCRESLGVQGCLIKLEEEENDEGGGDGFGGEETSPL
jgi:phage/plasmid-associated DNA primase